MTLTSSPKRFILLGDAGAGKSSIINFLYNLFYGTQEVDEIFCDRPKVKLATPCANWVDCLDQKYQYDNNERDINDQTQSQTQKCTKYIFQAKGIHLEMIDTPGFNDTNGTEVDEYNLTLIEETRKSLPYLSGISIVANGALPRLGVSFKNFLHLLHQVWPNDLLNKIVYQSARNATTVPLVIAFWPFDNNTLDLYGDYDGTLIGSGTYTTSFLGYGTALNLVQSASQYVSITSNHLPLNSRSFTIEAWIYLTSSTANDYGIFSQCPSTSANLCFDFMTRTNRLYCAIYTNGTQGATLMTINTWYHVACVYDMITQTQSVWLNGVLDGSSSATAYQDASGTTTIGAIYNSSSTVCFNGRIDQVRYESIAKTASEILNDATLYVYYSFDSSSLIDNGPNGINGTSFGNVTFTAGVVNEAARFSSGPYLYYTYSPFYFLGINNHPFSISLWVQPMKNYTESTLVFVHKLSGWCVHFLVINSTGSLKACLWNGGNVILSGPILPLNSWTHIGYTYSAINGIQLYINGTLYSTTGSITFSASGVPMNIILGSESDVH
ncbi:unnamed protein product [Rotaria socialis]|uniref:LamG-like jellyroll fold domain-containing protein n=1 Tax=Rotaria socialis TaxID=392032 RepID=A0A819W5U0_9BILA|nr:unnamed protein product [Rotaria socialis]CAF4120663.1 unnamed protein product [Rotaria socialis]